MSHTIWKAAAEALRAKKGKVEVADSSEVEKAVRALEKFLESPEGLDALDFLKEVEIPLVLGHHEIGNGEAEAFVLTGEGLRRLTGKVDHSHGDVPVATEITAAEAVQAAMEHGKYRAESIMLYIKGELRSMALRSLGATAQQGY